MSCGPGFFRQNPTDARAALAMVHGASDVLASLLEGSRTTVAGRLAGGFRNIGRERITNDIVKIMRTAGGYPWTVIPMEKRNNYMGRWKAQALNRTSSRLQCFSATLFPTV